MSSYILNWANKNARHQELNSPFKIYRKIK